MNDIQSIVDNFLAAAARLERLTGQINAMADQLEPALGGGVTAPEVRRVPVADFVQEAMTPPAGLVVADDRSVINYQGENSVPQTPQGAAPSSAVNPAAPTAGAVEVEGLPETPRPAGPTTEAPPWETQAAAPAAEPKKGGRRTLEQIADDLGVNLDDVKRWKGAGKRVGKKDMEEFKALAEKAGNSAPAAPSNPFPPAPVTPAATSVPPQAAPVPPQQAPAAGEQFGEWPTIEGGFDPSNPFGG